jgi:hypothetical protein
MKTLAFACVTLLSATLAQAAAGSTAQLAREFAQPPDSARPWVYWFPLEGNITSNGITADLEAMKRVGIGGVLYMETDQGAPEGPAPFGGQHWRDLFKHICSEASRLGLEVNMNNDAGWCGSGGPWITPELSMQRLVWTETTVTGPQHYEAILPQPKAVMDYYKDIAVFAYPTPESSYTISHLNEKSAQIRGDVPAQASFPPLPAGAITHRDQIRILTAQCDASGKLTWDIPPGKWTVLRLGHTTTGKDNHPAPIAGRGLECDKLSKAGAEAAFAGLMAKLINDSRPLTGKGKTLVSTHIDSWEVGSQNWTPKFREEFQRLRGYDPLPLLPVMTGRVVDSLEISERFLWDVRQTINDLLVSHYAGRFRELAHQHGIRLSIEAYDGEPADDMTYAGQADEPMAEFWSWSKFGAAHSCVEMSSAAHIYGKQILGAEAFTATDAEKWQGHPALIKDLGDWAFCEGINRFVFHRYALQPWTNPDRLPGMSMGPWGLHYERTQTWWEQSRAWHQYLARCQYLLQQGAFVADLCFLEPEISPQTFKSPVKDGLDRPGYNFDGCTPEAVLTLMKVRDGRLVLPGGATYRALVLPTVPTMTPELLRKISDLVTEGATVVGAPPLQSPSLSHYPQCDQEIATLTRQLWGTGPAPASLAGHRVGKGRLFWGGDIKPLPTTPVTPEQQLGAAQWIWRSEGNPAQSAPPGKRYFRHAFALDSTNSIASARLTLTADNTFECRINGQIAGSGDNWARLYEFDAKPLLKSGDNQLVVEAINTTDSPNPAGLIGRLNIQFTDDRTLGVQTDRQWQAADSSEGPWAPAMELGALGVSPWGDLQSSPSIDPTPDIKTITPLLAAMGVPPDFESQTPARNSVFRYTHRQLEALDYYFVANKNLNVENALCSFRIQGREPELWWPDTGRIEHVAVFEEKDGVTRIPIRLEPSGSVFVVFPKHTKFKTSPLISVTRDQQTLLTTDSKDQPASKTGAPNSLPPITLNRDANGHLKATVAQSGHYELLHANGTRQQFEAPSLPTPLSLGGAWDLRFPPHWGAPEHIQLPELISWTQHTNAGVRYFSGTATYSKHFDFSPQLQAQNRRWLLDLGKVAVMAEVKLNGKDLGILWKTPFALDVTDALRPGDNELELRVVNLWINRQIGDEQLPEDADRNPDGTLKAWPKWINEGKPSPTGRFTFSSWKLWNKDSPLVESGLIGPVMLHPVQTLVVPGS